MWKATQWEQWGAMFDNYFTGNKNIENFLDNINFELIRHDICEPYYAEVDKFITWPPLHLVSV